MAYCKTWPKTHEEGEQITVYLTLQNSSRIRIPIDKEVMKVDALVGLLFNLYVINLLKPLPGAHCMKSVAVFPLAREHNLGNTARLSRSWEVGQFH